MRRRAAAAVLLFATAGAMADEPVFRLEERIEVPAAGWVRVALDSGALAHGLAHEDWQVRDAAGHGVATRVLHAISGGVAIQSVSVTERPEGWRLVFDVGPTPVAHRRLTIRPSAKVLAARCRLEGSDDLEAWRSLAEASLYRLGDAAQLERVALDYPVSRSRFLALTWPRAAGFPALSDAAVEADEVPPGGWTAIPAAVESGTGPLSTRLVFPAFGLPARALHVTLDRAVTSLYVVASAHRGAWRAVAEGHCANSSTVTTAVGSGTAWRSATLALALPSAPDARVVSATIDVAPVWLLFHAPALGTYALVYGRVGGGAVSSAADLDPEHAPVRDVPAARPQSRPVPPLPAGLVAPVAPEKGDGGDESFAVIAPDAKPGAVVRVEIPDALYARIGDGTLAGVRLVSGTQRLPFVSAPLDVPGIASQRALELRDALTAPADRAKFTWTVDLPPLAESATTLQLNATLGAGNYTVTAALSAPGSPGQPPRRASTSAGSWLVSGGDAQRSMLLIDCGAPREARSLQLTLDASQGAAVQDLRVIVWRERRGLVFVWPRAGSVRLSIGHRPSPNPFPALQTRAEELLAAGFVSASVDLNDVQADRTGSLFGSRGLLVAALATVAMTLLALLARTLAHRR